MPDLCLQDISRKANLVADIIAKITQGEEISPDDFHALDILLLSGDNDSQVPYLDRSFLQHAPASRPQIVRHLGMVQNMLDPEYYVSNCGGKSTHFRDSPVTTDIPEIDLASNLAERTPLMVVPIPFTTDWFANRLRSSHSSYACTCSTTGTDATSDMSATATIPESPEALVNRKRDRDSPEEHNYKSKQRVQNDDPSRMECDNDRDNQERSCDSIPDWWPAGCMGSDPDACAVLAKLYYDQCSSTKNFKRKLRLNDLVEMVGVFSMDPWEAEFSTEDDFFGAVPPPPSRLPRLHVLTYRILELDSMTPTMFGDSKTTGYESKQLPDPNTNALDLLTDTLKNPLLAETLLMGLHSTAERQEIKNQEQETSLEMQRAPQHAVGCASLQLSTSNSKALFDHLEGIIKGICPVMVSIDLSQHRISSPSKEDSLDSQHTITPPSYINGRLNPNCLQLPKGSTILVHVDDSCRMNIDLLVELVSQHRIAYVFDGGMNVPFDADYR